MKACTTALLCLGMAASVTLAGNAIAQSSGSYTSSFQVRIGIEGTCNALTTSNIDFGDHIPTAGTLDANGTINVQCTMDTPFTVGLDGGLTTANVTARAMTNGTVQIPYALAHDAAMTQPWGNTSPTWHEGTGLGLGSAYNIAIPVYARATIAGNEPPGTYTDTVTATLTY
ncbi:SCPU domain-containing protein [Dyella solisilvae]|uniref:SCPU domain-containing protein n=1 Tax=Dyella solisilvae TaxID=1920168 RepID=A0A370K374_9GAMM|nr:spore coat U domain-containing protein [Dyella solisilvae]RDI97125.1 SCPU domain-containing protein [Dyella solisilvae]